MKNALTLALALACALPACGQNTSQRSFALVKSMAGDWQGKTDTGEPVSVSYRIAAGGSLVLSEIEGHMGGHAEDMISTFYLDGDRLLLTHYCQIGNQPRLKAQPSADGKTITFDFLDATNLPDDESGHIYRLTVTMLDDNHHIEEWRFMDHGKELVQRFDLQKKG